MSQMLSLPTERLEQLRLIAAANNLSTTTLAIAHLIRREISAGTISADIPGVAIAESGNGVSIALGDRTPTIYSKSAVLKLADTISSVASGQGSGVADLDDNWIVMGRGTGVRLNVPAGAEPKAFSRDVALDIAELLIKAAK